MARLLSLKHHVLADERRRWLALGIVCLGQLMMVLDVTIVNVALRSIQGDLHVGAATLTWVVDAYLISYGSFLLLAGRLGDLLGRKRVFLIGVVLFTVASAVCGAASSGGMLVAARFVQGLGGAVTASAILALIVVDFPDPVDRAKAMSAYTFVSVAGGSIGLIAGGILTELLSWHWIFFVNLPIGVIAFAAGRSLLREGEVPGLRGGIDVPGSLLMTGAAMLGIYAIIQSHDHGLASARTLGLAGGAVVLAAAFLWLESRLADPIFPLRILRVRTLMVTSVVRGCLVTGMFGAFFLGALYLERVQGFSPIQTGLAFLPQTIVVAFLSLGRTAKLARRFGDLPVLRFGVVTTAVALGMLVFVDADTAYFPIVFIAYAVLGLGAGCAFMTLVTVGLADVPPRDAGLASGIFNVSVQMAGAVGLAVLGTIAASRTKTLAPDHTAIDALAGGYQLGFGIAAGAVLVGLLVATFALRRPAEATAPGAGSAGA